MTASEKEKLRQAILIDAGKCKRCRATREPGMSRIYCLKCLRKVRERQRLLTGCQEWVAGGKGHPPLEHWKRKERRR